MNVTRIARRIAENQPDEKDVLGSYFARYGA
jgi:hypothetical protein